MNREEKEKHPIAKYVTYGILIFIVGGAICFGLECGIRKTLPKPAAIESLPR